MRSRLKISLCVLLPSAAAGMLALASPSSQACGPYGGFERDVLVEVVSAQPASSGVTVRAVCGEDEFFADAQPDGSFVLVGLPRTECVVEATAHECYRSDRIVMRSAGTSLRHLQLEIPAD